MAAPKSSYDTKIATVPTITAIGESKSANDNNDDAEDDDNNNDTDEDGVEDLDLNDIPKSFQLQRCKTTRDNQNDSDDESQRVVVHLDNDLVTHRMLYHAITGRTCLVWAWKHAPSALCQAMSAGGDENYLAFVPSSAGHTPSYLFESSSFGCCSVIEYTCSVTEYTRGTCNTCSTFQGHSFYVGTHA